MRVFLAIPVSEELKESLYAQAGKLRQVYPKCKWVGHENYHITSLFLGSVETRQADRMCKVLDGLPLCSQGEISLSEMICFPNPGRPVTIAAGLRDISCIAGRIHHQVSSAFPESGDSRKYTPHITLGRIRRNSRIRNFECAGFVPAGSFTASRLVMYESRLEAGGAVYNEVYSVSFPSGSGALQ